MNCDKYWQQLPSTLFNSSVIPGYTCRRFKYTILFKWCIFKMGLKQLRYTLNIKVTGKPELILYRLISIIIYTQPYKKSTHEVNHVKIYRYVR